MVMSADMFAVLLRYFKSSIGNLIIIRETGDIQESSEISRVRKKLYSKVTSDTNFRVET